MAQDALLFPVLECGYIWHRTPPSVVWWKDLKYVPQCVTGVFPPSLKAVHLWSNHSEWMIIPGGTRADGSHIYSVWKKLSIFIKQLTVFSFVVVCFFYIYIYSCFSRNSVFAVDWIVAGVQYTQDYMALSDSVCFPAAFPFPLTQFEDYHEPAHTEQTWPCWATIQLTLSVRTLFKRVLWTEGELLTNMWTTGFILK